MSDNIQASGSAGPRTETLATKEVSAGVHLAKSLPTDDAGTYVPLATQATAAAINTAVGAQADASASSDAGTFSVIAFIKRGLANWTTLLARIPALVSGRVPTADDAATVATP